MTTTAITLTVGQTIKGGIGEDFDVGTIVDVEDDVVTVSWRNAGCQTRERAADLLARLA